MKTHIIFIKSILLALMQHNIQNPQIYTMQPRHNKNLAQILKL
ncbi:hypothetical protein [Helicobacter bilis]|nr:hypothetical protein [Helicobacter bilis]